MKRFLILLALISAPVFSAENWDRTQLNLKLQKNDWSIKYREYVAGLDSDGEVDKFHWQMSYKYDNWRFDYQYWEKDGKVELRYDNVNKFETTTDGVVITGICTATSFEGSGANLTNLPASGDSNDITACLFI